MIDNIFVVDKENDQLRVKYQTQLWIHLAQCKEMTVGNQTATVPGPVRIFVPEKKISGNLMVMTDISFSFDSSKDYSAGTLYTLEPGMKIMDLRYVVEDAAVLNYMLNFFKGTNLNYSDVFRGYLTVQLNHSFVLNYPVGLAACLFAVMLKDRNGNPKRFTITDPNDTDFVVEPLKQVPREASSFTAVSFEDIEKATTANLIRTVGRENSPLLSDSREGISLQEKLVFYQQNVSDED